MAKQKNYFPNKWKQFHDIPSNKYEPFPFDLLMDMKDMWELKRTHICVVRAENKKGQIKEHAYQRIHAAKKKVSELMKNSKEFTVLTYDAIHHIKPDEFFNQSIEV
tara:strand:+ start:664 stop:981 length:318 start_codon:yes stop_codon:yes gene_type:complete